MKWRGIIINTARTDLMGVKNIQMEDRLLIGQTKVKGHGVGTDNVTGAKVVADELIPSSTQSTAAAHTTLMHLSSVPVLEGEPVLEELRFSAVT